MVSLIIAEVLESFMLSSYGKQSIDLDCKSIDWILYSGNISIKCVKFTTACMGFGKNKTFQFLIVFNDTHREKLCFFYKNLLK